jgi:hypothetical protein
VAWFAKMKLFTRELVELYGFTFYFVVLLLVVRIELSQIKAF